MYRIIYRMCNFQQFCFWSTIWRINVVSIVVCEIKFFLISSFSFLSVQKNWDEHEFLFPELKSKIVNIGAGWPNFEDHGFCYLVEIFKEKNLLITSVAEPKLSIISALAPAPAIYCHLKLYYNSSTIRIMSQ